ERVPGGSGRADRRPRGAAATTAAGGEDLRGAAGGHAFRNRRPVRGGLAGNRSHQRNHQPGFDLRRSGAEDPGLIISGGRSLVQGNEGTLVFLTRLLSVIP